jgi:hypothetical protein
MNTPSWLAQIEFAKRVTRQGYAAYFCFGWEHGKIIIENYLNNASQ